MSDTDFSYMQLALEEAKKAESRREVPIGAVLVSETGGIRALAGNRTREQADPTAHAEILAIREECARRGEQRLPDCDLYVTLEPCAMCAAAISFARIRRLIIAAKDPKGGGVWHGGRFYEQPTCHHRSEIIQGPLAEESGEILKKFFKARR